MKKTMRICGYATSTFKFGGDTLYLIKFDDGRFEYRGLINIPAIMDCAEIPYPIASTKNCTAIATNAYFNSRNMFVSATCSAEIVRVDITMPENAIPTFSTGINLHVQGFWK